jgi:hypothetical protein
MKVSCGIVAAQHRKLKIPDYRPAAAEAQAVANQRPEHCDQRHQRETLHHDGQYILVAHQPAVKERQPRPGHHQHQRRADQHPGVIRVRLRRGHSLIQLAQLVGDGFRCIGGGSTGSWRANW